MRRPRREGSDLQDERAGPNLPEIPRLVLGLGIEEDIPTDRGNVVDLMAALKKSLGQAESDEQSPTEKPARPAKPAKRAAAQAATKASPKRA